MSERKREGKTTRVRHIEETLMGKEREEGGGGVQGYLRTAVTDKQSYIQLLSHFCQTEILTSVKSV